MKQNEILTAISIIICIMGLLFIENKIKIFKNTTNSIIGYILCAIGCTLLLIFNFLLI